MLFGRNFGVQIPREGQIAKRRDRIIDGAACIQDSLHTSGAQRAIRHAEIRNPVVCCRIARRGHGHACHGIVAVTPRQLVERKAAIRGGGWYNGASPARCGDRHWGSPGGEYGDVTSIGLRSVKLRTLDDCTVTIPNNLFLSEVTSSGNSGHLEMQTVVDFYIGLEQDVHLARDLVRSAAATSRYIYLPLPIKVQVSQAPLDGCIAMKVRLKAYVLDTKYEMDFQTDIVLRAHQSFEENQIMPPAALH